MEPVIKHTIVSKKDGTEAYHIFGSEDFEYTNPIIYYKAIFLYTNFTMLKDITMKQAPFMPLQIVEKVIKAQVNNEWKEKLRQINRITIPNNLLQLLKSEKKKDQIRLLKEVSITPDQLIAFIFKAHSVYEFTFSQYRSEHNNSNVNNEKMPTILEVREGIVNKVGDTTLTDRQLKQSIEQRTVVISKFLYRGNTWHCFFVTYNSLAGKENRNDGQPHYHYISDKFGLAREQVVEELKKKEYKLNNCPHIPILDYRENDF